MAQPSVAREPSMEEILASIRRIIESNDPVSGETFASDSDEMDGGAHAPALRQAEVDFSYESVDFTPANDPGPAAPAPQRVEAQVQPEASRSVSLADLAARVRSASERTERPVQPSAAVAAPVAAAPAVEQPMAAARDMQPSRGESPLMTARLAELRAPQLRPSISVEIKQAPVAVRPPQAPEVAVAAEPVPARPAPAMMPDATQTISQAPVIEPERRDMPEMQLEMQREEPRAPSFDAIAMHLAAEPRPEPVAEDAAQSSAGTDLTALVSAATVEQVSRSFSDLAAAIDGQERRSLDEMAEEMLRPMLKDWLDDNLPTLVERLVREEIERVARGPRR